MRTRLLVSTALAASLVALTACSGRAGAQDAPAPDAVDPPFAEYRRLAAALPRYQASGTPQQVAEIERSLESWRGLPRQFPRGVVIVNVPEFMARVYDAALKKMQQSDWEQQVLQRSRLSGVFLTNDFDDPLVGWDTTQYVPCLRTDDLVLELFPEDAHLRRWITLARDLHPEVSPAWARHGSRQVASQL